jgi:glutamyl-tRNA reductase
VTDVRPELGLTAYVVHARNVPSEARESFGEVAGALAGDPRVIVLRTCHRVELYVSSNERAANEAAEPQLEGLPDLPAGGQAKHGADAARHLFAVAAGLDSVVLGEDQVLHQLRECLTDRHLLALEDASENCADGNRANLPMETPSELSPLLDRLFQLALHVGRQTRAWREGPPRSLADVALDRIEAVAPLAGRQVLIVGAGQMSRIAALAAARRNAHVIVSNRTRDRAAHLAADVGGATVEFGDLPADAAGIICAVAGPWPLNRAAKEALVAATNESTVVDLSSPPALDDALRAALGERFVSVDDIARGPSETMRPKLRRRMERLIDEAVAELTRWVAGRSAVPTIQALTDQAETRRAAEVERLLRRMPGLADHERELVEQMSHRLVAGLLHAPLASLRDDQNGEREEVARELFAL